MTTRSTHAARQKGMTGFGPKGMTDEEFTASATVYERIQTIANDTPEDAATTIKATWPDLWMEIVAAGRGAGLRPVPMMMYLIQKGLDG
jgi:hypothetical protein